jgi:hypothetical protein
MAKVLHMCRKSLVSLKIDLLDYEVPFNHEIFKMSTLKKLR